MKSTIVIIAAILSLITSAASADPVGGSKYGRGVLQAGERDSYTVYCRADETTIFQITGDGDGDLDCRLEDEHGNVVDSDYGPQDGCRLSVIPRRAGSFTLYMYNSGNEATLYHARFY